MIPLFYQVGLVPSKLSPDSHILITQYVSLLFFLDVQLRWHYESKLRTPLLFSFAPTSDKDIF